MTWMNITVGLLLLIFSVIPSAGYFPLLLAVALYQIGRRVRRIPTRPFRPVALLLFMFLFGLLFADYGAAYEVLKDAWYLVKVLLLTVVGLMIGYFAPRDDRTLALAAACSSLGVLTGLLSHVLANSSVQGSTYLPPISAALILPFFLLADANSHRAGRLARWLIALPIITAIALSSSRTTLLILFVAWLGARGTLQSRNRLVVAALAVAGLAWIAIPMLPDFDPHNYTFIGKVKNSLNEMSFVTDDDMTSITANWRGFEAYRAYAMWEDAPLLEQLLGHGMGTAIDIGFYYPLLGDQEFRYLPILHNGYFMVLVKYGVFGLAAFVAFITAPFWLTGVRKGESADFAARLAVTGSAILLVSTASITGPFNLTKLDGVTLLMAWAIGLRLKATRSQASALSGVVQRSALGDEFPPIKVSSDTSHEALR